jgi:2-polyprenyl-3-methyl-5-hydroxy-6-metoxy-1,4-benzoquinol methylase
MKPVNSCNHRPILAQESAVFQSLPRAFPKFCKYNRRPTTPNRNIAANCPGLIFNMKLLSSLNLIRGDTLVLDRWIWLAKRLPLTRDNLRLLDVGCGSGAFTIMSALRGYTSTGLSWDNSNNSKATSRSISAGVSDHCSFEICDVRQLANHSGAEYDVVINCENIEHILDDIGLMRNISRKLKPGGYLLLTTPYYFYRPITKGEAGPFSKVEDGGHVRRGYSKSMLIELCEKSGMVPEEISFCSGFFSQKVTFLWRILNKLIGIRASWTKILPLRTIPLMLDPLARKIFRYPDFSICMVAFKPRY